MKKHEKEAEKISVSGIESLKRLLPKGVTIYTILRSISKSGMQRQISVIVVHNGRLEDITYYVANAGLYNLSIKSGWRALVVRGCGMDMGFSVADDIARVCGLSQEEWHHEWL
jgi:hypothetical protein